MPVIMGTAGHIDHGKTTLIKALSGIDCDRLKDEQKRGITIELGFAFLDLKDKTRLGIIDVPGHEKFVKNMVAGASGIDFVLLVIATDEGIMPQTKEHLEICSLLGIQKGIIALTKIDMVDEELRELAQEEILEYMQGTFLADAPVIPVSAHTGQGLDTLTSTIEKMVKSLHKTEDQDLFRLPVDRAFTIKGHGTVITGTLISGKINLGESIAVYPQQKISKVRGLEVHGQSQETALAGQRTAMNLAGLEVTELTRGDVIARPGTLFPSQTWSVQIEYLESAPKPLGHRKEIHFHHGTKDTLARIYLLDRDKLQPGERAIAQIHFSEPMVGVFGDRFVIRSFSPLRTIAGGIVVNPISRPLRKRSPQATIIMQLTNEDPVRIITNQLLINSPQGLTKDQLKIMTNLPDKKLELVMKDLQAKQAIHIFDREEMRFIGAETLNELSQELLNFVQEFHKKNPLLAGISRAEIKSNWGRGLPPKLVHFILEKTLKKNLLCSEQEVLRHPEHKVALKEDQNKLKQQILKTFLQAGQTPPTLKALLDKIGANKEQVLPVLGLLCKEGVLIKVKDELYFHTQAIDQTIAQIQKFFTREAELTPSKFKDLTGLSRKYAIPLLEYLDRAKVTIRIGDIRKLRKQKESN